MVPKPGIKLSEEGLALFTRAELASAQARHLLDENDRWRRSALAQLDYMFELGAEFRSGRRAPTPTGFRIPAAPNSSRDLR
jgi:hypothetical protein